MIYMFFLNNPLSGDINSSNLPCFNKTIEILSSTYFEFGSYKANG